MLNSVKSIGLTIGSAAWLMLDFGLYFWLILKSRHRNRLIESGPLTILVFLTIVPLSKIPGPPGSVPVWVFALWTISVVLLCFTTLFFLAQRIVGAVRRLKSK